MPAPTALQLKPEEVLVDDAPPASIGEQDDEFTLDSPSLLTDAPSQPQTEEQLTEMQLDTEDKPLFAPAFSTTSPMLLRVETRKIPIPPHRFTPLKNNWTKIYPPLVKHLHLQVRMNTKARAVELRTSKFTTDNGALQKGEDFVRSFALGFDVDDAIAMLRLDNLYLQSFEIKDVKTLNGEHLGRAVGRIAGKDGKTKFAIENATRTRVVLADTKIHIMGGFSNIAMARESIVDLIRGKPQGKVYNNLRIMSSRMKEQF